MKNLNQFTKRTLALLLALAMCLGMLGLSAFAEEVELDDAANVEESIIEENSNEEQEPAVEEDPAENEDIMVLTEEESGDENVLPETEGEESKDKEDENEPDPETGYTVVWNWGYTGAPDEGVYATQTASELDENGRPVIDDPESPVRQDYLFMYWTDFEQAEDGSYVTTAKWEKDVKVDPTVPESERSEWGDNIPDSWQVTVGYYVNNGSFSFEGQDGLRCTLTNLHSDTGPACKTVVTARDGNGNPTKWYDGCTATLAPEHLPTGVPDEGYTKGTWYYSDYYVYGDPAVGSAINPGASSVTMRLVYSDPSTKVTVTYQHNTSDFSWGKWAFENKDQWETLFTVEIDRGEWYETWKPGKISDDYDVGGWTPNRQVDDITPNSPFGLHEGWHYSITEDLILRVNPTIKSSGSGTVGVCPSPNVTYEWGAVTPRVDTLPIKIGYYEGVTVGIANGPSGIVTGTDGNKYLFKGWKLTSGSVASAVPASGIVARSLTLSNEDIVLTAQWEAYEEAKVLVQWLAGYPGAQPSVIQTAQVDKSNVREWNNGDIDLFGVDYPANPERSGYKFTGWSKPVKNADGSITITAQWIEHVHSYTQTKDPSCTEAGEKTCSCGDKQEIPALGHKWGEWKETTPATCEGKGEETRVCSRDDSHVETRETEALGHDWGEWKDNEDGTHSQVCNRDDSHVNSEKEEHTGEWKTTKDPTDTEPGEKERECDKCGHKDTEEIPAKGEEKPENPEPEQPEQPDPEPPVVPTPTPTPVTPNPIIPRPVNPNPTPEQPDPTPDVEPENPGEDIDDEDPPLAGEPGEDIGEDDPPLAGEPGEDIGEDDPPLAGDPGEDINDEDPPLAGDPGEDIGEDDPPLAGEPGEDIGEDDPPLAGEPGEEIGDPGEDIPDGGVPMTDVPQTGEASNVLWLAAVVTAGAGLVLVNTGKRKEENQ